MANDTVKLSPARRWAPRVWIGSTFGVWLRLMARHRFAVHYSLWHIALADGLLSPINSVLALSERLAYGRQVAQTELNTDPIFVLGHWRSGTSWFHELLSEDTRFAAPTAFDCIAPHHCLISSGFLPRILTWVTPERRPMDEMTMDLNSPFEDEFALALLGARSPYATIAFCNQVLMTPDLFDPDDFPERQRKKWRDTMSRFVRKLQLRHPGQRLIFKSPPHTCRIRTLLELFPNARFIHITRNPYVVYASTMHTWRRLRSAHGYQRPVNEDLSDTVLQLFLHFDQCYQRDRRLIASDRLCEIRYEQLADNPMQTMEHVYDTLQLGEFEAAGPQFESHLAARADYQTNRYQIDAADLELIDSHWGEVIHRCGYERPTSTTN